MLKITMKEQNNFVDNNIVILYILSVYGTSVVLFLAYRTSRRMTKNTASKAPPDAPNIMAI